MLLILACGCVMADDIVTMPTANQLKAGDVDAAVYYLKLDSTSPDPEFVQYQTVYVGLTDRIELDAHRAAIDNNETATVLVGSFKLMSETAKTPDLVIGCRNLGGTATVINPRGSPVDYRDKSKDRSYFLSGAKTFFFNPSLPGPPLVRVHLSVGTADWTLLNEKRHQGVFGGLQFLIRPDFGAVVENDGLDTITGLTYMPKNTGLTIKGGGFGQNWWAGIAFRKNLGF